MKAVGDARPLHKDLPLATARSSELFLFFFLDQILGDTVRWHTKSL